MGTPNKQRTWACSITRLLVKPWNGHALYAHHSYIQTGAQTVRGLLKAIANQNDQLFNTFYLFEDRKWCYELHVTHWILGAIHTNYKRPFALTDVRNNFFGRKDNVD